MTKTFDQGKEEVAKLCQYFATNRQAFLASGVNEAHVRQSLIDPLFEALAAISHQFFERPIGRLDGRSSCAFVSAGRRQGTSRPALATMASWNEVVPTEGQGLAGRTRQTSACACSCQTMRRIPPALQHFKGRSCRRLQIRAHTSTYA